MIPGRTAPHTPQDVWVVFSGKTELWWLRFLKPGFRHCFVLLRDKGRWISIDPLSHYTEVAAHHGVPANFDLPGWLESRGHAIARGHINRSHTKAAPWMVFSCVEAVKRLLGLHERFILTPWQLYSHLQKTQKTK